MSTCMDAGAPATFQATFQARRNSEYVRRALEEKQPEFAALLELLEAELACPVCRVTDRGPVSGSRGT
jgi:hypothetical protein